MMFHQCTKLTPAQRAETGTWPFGSKPAIKKKQDFKNDVTSAFIGAGHSLHGTKNIQIPIQ